MTIDRSSSLIAWTLMALPNLFGIMLLLRDMKQTVSDYWQRFK